MKTFFAILVLLTAFVIWAPRGAAVITLGTNGFFPSRVRVAVGSPVVFRTTAGRPFWPASNAHPRHLLYADFDSKVAIARDASWEFIPQRTGTWQYHNHLRPWEQATLVVFDPKTGNQSSCAPAPAADDLAGNVSCWHERITERLEKEGIPGAFSLVRELYDRDGLFVRVCHDMTHVIGSAAGENVAAGGALEVGPEAESCGYGFFHGLVETLMLHRMPVEKLFAVCEGARSNGPYACYHGIGHGLFDSLESSSWGDEEAMTREVLAQCESISGIEREEFRKQCASGVFNALANAYADGSYGLSMRADDPLWICTGQEDWVYRAACVREVAVVSIRTHGFSRPEAIAFITSLPDAEDQAMALFAYVADEARRQLAFIDPDTVAQWCRDFSGTLRSSCIAGLATIIAERSRPGQECVAVREFCGSDDLSVTEKQDCSAVPIARVCF